MMKCILNYGMFATTCVSDGKVSVKPNSNDYVIHFILGLLESSSLNQQISPIIPRVILNILAMKLNDGSIQLSVPMHQQWAMQVFPNIKADLISDFILKFSLQNLVTDDLLL